MSSKKSRLKFMARRGHPIRENAGGIAVSPRALCLGWDGHMVSGTETDPRPKCR